MLKIKKGKPYTSKVVGKELVPFHETRCASKVYFVDIVGRDEPAKYEWAHCGRTQDEFVARLREFKPEGIGFVTAFPHITKVFQFGPNPETNLYTRAYHTETFEEMPLDYSGATEVACAAEALILAEEFKLWLAAKTVDEYLGEFTDAGDAAFANHEKMLQRFGGE